jgi:hypothetical protein
MHDRRLELADPPAAKVRKEIVDVDDIGPKLGDRF